MMNICRADMTLDEMEATLQFEIVTPIKINPEEPLNFHLPEDGVHVQQKILYSKGEPDI
ncbi:hypothetical protein NERG_01309 [Nematocida ausubeli]|uniref:Uncharacterized protein n=1 Tax=Nematocida ausubeli (strain ATCC PRA-371 / ERTm2) TaxID=1913371 RepID=H8ZC66_NEMA1|nr:hypothetical protein NERG_01309 [Nematocida ausubeli]